MPINILSINVDSIYHFKRKLLLENMLTDNNIDICMVQETKLCSDDKFFISKFNIFCLDIKKGKGGVALIVKNSINIKKCVRTITPFNSISIECFIDNVWVRFGSIYIPHGIKNIENHFTKFFNKNKNTFFGGDFNSCHLSFGDSSQNEYGKALFNTQFKLNLKIINPNVPTCYASDEGSFIDKFITTDTSFVCSNINVLSSFSDHSGIAVSLPINSIKFDDLPNIKNFHNANTNKINKYLHNAIFNINIPNSTNLANSELENICNMWNDHTASAIDRFVPNRKNNGNRILLNASTRALQNKCKKLQKKIIDGHGFTPLSEKKNLLSQIKLLKKMIHDCEFRN